MFRAKHFFHANITMKQALKSRETISLERSGRFQKILLKKTNLQSSLDFLQRHLLKQEYCDLKEHIEDVYRLVKN
jgi:hypothetical protein